MVLDGEQQSQDLGHDYVPIGKIVKPHGVKGEVKVFPFSGRPENFKSYSKVIAAHHNNGLSRSLVIQRVRIQGELAILQFEEVVNRDGAEMLCGSQLWLNKHDFPQLESGEYYWFELQGMRVITSDGQELGIVTSIFNTKAHDIMVVTDQDREYLIPIKDEIIQQMDDQARLMVISTIPGLLELNNKELGAPETGA